MKLACSIIVTGHVQGVFFREWAVRVASTLGVTGWVRNRRDGSVEVYAVGSADQLDRFVSELRNGSPASRADALGIKNAPVEVLAGFLRRSTV
jgi:acylphosphatase